MRNLVEIAAVALFAIPAAQGRPPTPTEQFEALRQESNRAASSGRLLSDAERLQFIGQAYRYRSALALKFVELAKRYPEDLIALDSLTQAVWQVNTTPWPVEIVGEDSARALAFAQIERDHIDSDRLGPLCQRVSYGFAREYEAFLRAVLAKNPHAAVRGRACLALAHFLNNRRQRLDLLQDQPQSAQEFAVLYGQNYLAELRSQDREQVGHEIEAFLRQALAQYADVPLDGGTVGARAKAELFEVTHLVPGKEAPDIEGQDQHGARFKLSDYRGKVVLLDFWSFV